MNRVGKIVPPKRKILEDISLSFFPGAKIGVLGLNGSGKSTLLRIMAGLDTDILGEARPQPDLKIGYLEQEPQLDPNKTVRGNVEEGVREAIDALSALEQVYADYAEPDADFDALAKKQAQLEDIIQATDAHNLGHTLEVAADALRLPPWDADVFAGAGSDRGVAAVSVAGQCPRAGERARTGRDVLLRRPNRFRLAQRTDRWCREFASRRSCLQPRTDGDGGQPRNRRPYAVARCVSGRAKAQPGGARRGRCFSRHRFLADSGGRGANASGANARCHDAEQIVGREDARHRPIGSATEAPALWSG